ncbi:MAG: hypothetical protein ABR564_07520 [Candidatus Dormibacteria bacterium]
MAISTRQPLLDLLQLAKRDAFFVDADLTSQRRHVGPARLLRPGVAYSFIQSAAAAT